MITVIVPIFNVQSYLHRCLDSLCDQKFRDFEVILVDDGSTDNSASIAKSYVEKDCRFLYVYQENSGQGEARNHGINLAKGEYLSFIDSDDWVQPNFLQVLFDLIKNNGADISSCSATRCFENGRTAECSIQKSTKSVTEDIDGYLKTASFSVWNKLYDRRLFENLRFEKKLKYEDYALMPQVYARCKKIASTDESLYMYFFRSNSTTNMSSFSLDMLKAHWILDESEFGQVHQELMTQYFVRQIMGSLVWKIIQDFQHFDLVDEILLKGKEMYPSLDQYVNSKWGKYLLSGQYHIAAMYAVLHEKPKAIFKKVISLFDTIRRK